MRRITIEACLAAVAMVFIASIVIAGAINSTRPWLWGVMGILPSLVCIGSIIGLLNAAFRAGRESAPHQSVDVQALGDSIVSAFQAAEDRGSDGIAIIIGELEALDDDTIPPQDDSSRES